MKNRIRSFALTAIALVSCHANAPATSAATVVTPAKNVDVDARRAPSVMALPSHPSMIGSIDLAALDPALVHRLATIDPALDSIVQGIEHEMGLASGAIAAHGLDALGIDRSRPLTFAIAAPSDGVERAVATMRSRAPTALPTREAKSAGITDQMRAAVEPVGSLVLIRVLVPTNDAARLRSVFASIFTRAGYTADRDGEFSRHGSHASLDDDGKTLALDIAQGATARESVDALRASLAHDRESAPALDGQTLRIAYTPKAMADLGFVAGLFKIAGALSGESIDPEQRDRIATEGLWEASQVFALTENARGPYFDRVVMTASYAGSKFEARVRAEPGAGFVAPPDAIWNMTTSVDFPNAKMQIDASKSASDAWPALGTAEETAPYRPALIMMMRDAGAMGMVLAVPHAFEVMASSLPRALGPRWLRAESLARFERRGVLGTSESGPDVVWGLLPENATRASAECVLEEKSPCAPSSRLHVNAIVKKNGDTATLFDVDHRLIVVIVPKGRTMPAKPILTPRGPFAMRLSLDQNPLVREAPNLAKMLPERFDGTVDREGSAIVVRLSGSR